ncbi:MAG: hypothetical protein KF683_01895 [Rubrivivax sp.]|nr:hypothetical protein [Rubrivivax sp.]
MPRVCMACSRRPCARGSKRDGVTRRRTEYLNDPRPSFATYGPRNRREFVAFRALHGDAP